MKKEDKKQQQAQAHHSDPNHSYETPYAFCYTLGHIHIIINPQIDVEILRTSTIYPIPHAPQWYRGTTSLRGSILPVVNMHFLLGITSTAPKNSKSTKQILLRLKHPDFSALVIATDGLPYQTDISTVLAHTTPNNNHHYPDWIKSSAKHHNRLYLFANYARLLTALQKNEQAKLIMPSSNSKRHMT